MSCAFVMPSSGYSTLSKFDNSILRFPTWATWVLRAGIRSGKARDGSWSTRSLAALRRDFIHPTRYRIQKFSADIVIFSSRSRRNMKRMIGLGNELERGATPEFPADRLQQWQLGKLILGPLQEEHRKIHLGEMLRAFC